MKFLLLSTKQQFFFAHDNCQLGIICSQNTFMHSFSIYSLSHSHLFSAFFFFWSGKRNIASNKFLWLPTNSAIFFSFISHIPYTRVLLWLECKHVIANSQWFQCQKISFKSAMRNYCHVFFVISFKLNLINKD